MPSQRPGAELRPGAVLRPGLEKATKSCPVLELFWRTHRAKSNHRAVGNKIGVVFLLPGYILL